MRFRFIDVALSVLVFASLSAPSRGDQPAQHDKDEVAVFTAAEIKWVEGPPSLPKGALVALLEGDPTKEGPFVIRVKLPDGYRVPPHTHPKTERLTVISGTFYIGMGDKFDQIATRPMPAGAYGYLASRNEAFRLGQGGDGPAISWQRTLVDQLGESA